MKYTLKKKFHPNQVEEVGHVFESDGSIFYKMEETRNTQFGHEVKPHDIALLISAGYLEKEEEHIHSPGVLDGVYKKSPFECISCGQMVDNSESEPTLDLWEEEPPERVCYWYITDFGGINPSNWDENRTDFWRLKTKNCHKTEESAELALKLLKEKLKVCLLKYWVQLYMR